MKRLTDAQRRALLIRLLEDKGVRFSHTRMGWQPVSCYGSGHYGGDRSPSASINLGVGAYRCHGCDLKGDAISLVMLERGVDFKGALAILEAEETTMKEESRWI